MYTHTYSTGQGRWSYIGGEYASAPLWMRSAFHFSDRPSAAATHTTQCGVWKLRAEQYSS